MSDTLPPPLPELPVPSLHVEEEARVWAPDRPSRIRRTLTAVWKLFAGMLCAQNPLGAVLLLGWTGRLMQRIGWMRWAGQSTSGSWETLLAADVRCAAHRHWPNWILSQNFKSSYRVAANGQGWRSVRQLGISLVSSLGDNLKIGFQILFNTWALTLPATGLMALAWYDGWNNSFNKGYEQALIGPLLGSLGTLGFIAMMFYVPLAQARQSVTGNWRTFYDFRLVWRLIRREWALSALLAAAYAVCSVPVVVLRFAPAFFPQIAPRLESLSELQARGLLQGYFFWAALLFLPVFFGLRCLAAMLYARAVLRAVHSGAVMEEELAEQEWKILNHLGLLAPQAPAEPARWVKAARWIATRTGQAVAGGFIFLCWFVFVAQVYIGEFFLYHPITGFLNHPLVQLPVFFPGR